MDAITGGSRRHTRRTVLWALFGIIGLLLGAAWATGFGSSQSTTSANNATATRVFGQSAAEPQTLSPYAAAVTNPANVAVTFDGLWGVIAADTLVFKVDLTGQVGTYYTTIYLKNFSSGNPWASEQYKWLEFDCSSANPLAADYTTAYGVVASNNAHEPKLMNITGADAHVSFPTLAGGNKWCFGIQHSTGTNNHADDTSGTFLTRPDTSAAPGAPLFTAVVNRSA
jgi:hypothetical protein